MKKVRLFAVAAAMGMFASSVSAAKQVGPVVTKTSGSFAWGEFASVMKVDMGDKVVAPSVTVTATTEGRTTDIDFATYKTASGLQRTSTCYVGFTNVVGKDTNLDGINDTPLYVIYDGQTRTNVGTQNGNNKYFSTVDEAIEYWAYAGADLFGTKILAPGQDEIDDVYTVEGSTQTFDGLDEIFDFLVSEEVIDVTTNDDGFITKVVFDETTYYEKLANGTNDEARPLGTMRLAYSPVITRDRGNDAVKKAIADLFVGNSVTQGESYKDLLDYSKTAGYGLYVEYTSTTPYNAAVYSDYEYEDTISRGVVDVTSTTRKIKGADIKNVGGVLVVEYDSKYDVYVPNHPMTKLSNSFIQFVEYVNTVAEYAASDDMKNSSKDTAPAFKAEVLAGTGLTGNAVAESAYDWMLTQVAWSTDATTFSGLVKTELAKAAGVSKIDETAAVKEAYALYYTAGTPTEQAAFDAMFKGNQDTAAKYDANTVKTWTASNGTSGSTLVELFEYAGLDYHPTASNVKDTFLAKGKVSIVEYDGTARADQLDCVVLSFGKTQAYTAKGYKTITKQVFDIVDMAWNTEVKTTHIDAANPDAVVTTPGAQSFTVDYDNGGAQATLAGTTRSYTELDYVNFLFGDGYPTVAASVAAGGAASYEINELEVGDEAYLAQAPENNTDYIVVNLKSTDVNPKSQSRTKGTATYVSPVTGEEVMTHFVELEDVGARVRTTSWYPAFETMADAKDFLRIVLGIVTPSNLYSGSVNADNYIAALTGDMRFAKAKTWADGTVQFPYFPANVLSDVSAEQCTYSTLKGSDVKTEAAAVTFDASKVDTSKAGTYTATLTAKAGETTETREVTVVVAPKYARTWDNKGRVSTLKAFWLSGNLYAEYKYTYNADGTTTVVSTFYREDGVTVADTATTTK